MLAGSPHTGQPVVSHIDLVALGAEAARDRSSQPHLVLDHQYTHQRMLPRRPSISSAGS